MTFRLKRGLVAFLAVAAACRSAGVPDDLTELPARRTDAAVWASRSSLLIRFPAIPLENAGCMYADSSGPDVRRRYQWHATVRFPGGESPWNHFMGVYVYFTLPDSVPLTAARLDSALASLHLTIDEAAGEPPMLRSRVEPRRARVSRAGDHVLLRIDDPTGVREFFKAGRDSVDVGWCQRDESLSYTRVRVRSRP